MLFVYQGMFQVASGDTPAFINALNSYAIGTPLDSQASALQTDDSLSPSSLDSVVAERSIKTENFGNSSSVNSLNCMDNNQVSSILYWNKPIMLICSYASTKYLLLLQYVHHALPLFCVAQASEQNIFTHGRLAFLYLTQKQYLI